MTNEERKEGRDYMKETLAFLNIPSEYHDKILAAFTAHSAPTPSQGGKEGSATIKNFHCSVHGYITPHPICPKCAPTPSQGGKAGEGKPEWEERYDKEFARKNKCWYLDGKLQYSAKHQDIKNFIRTLLTAEREKAYRKGTAWAEPSYKRGYEDGGAAERARLRDEIKKIMPADDGTNTTRNYMLALLRVLVLLDNPDDQ